MKMSDRIISKIKDDIDDAKSVFLKTNNRNRPKNKEIIFIELLKDPFKNWPENEKKRFQNKTLIAFSGLVVFFILTIFCALKWFGNNHIWGLPTLILMISAYVYHQLVTGLLSKKKALIEKEILR